METGHAKNLANFQHFTTTCQSIADYNPTNPLITITKFQQRYLEFQNELQNVATLRPDYIHAVNQRQLAFSPLKPLCTRILSALRASGADELTNQNALTIVRKIRGTRLRKSKQNPQTAGQNKKTISNSQRSCDMLIHNFSELISFLKTSPIYTPGVPDLEITALETFLQNLTQANKKVKSTHLKLKKAFTKRDNALYHNPDALLKIVKTAKQYVISLQGTKSPNYKLLTAIKFKKITN